MAAPHTDDLADRLEAEARDLDGSVAALVDNDLLILVVPAVRLRSVASMQVAAAELRRLRQHVATLTDAIGDAAKQLHGSHYQDPQIRSLCAVCGAADGSYPCVAHMVADDLTAAVEALDGEGR